MNRAEFMQQLGALLGDLPINERTEALKYYADYFDDAGSENEEQVIKELGSPQEVAGIIKAELNAKDKESGEFTEKGYKNPAYTTTAAPAAGQNNRANSSYTANDNAQSGQGTYTPKQNSAGKTALIVVLCILLIPVGIPFAIAVVSTVFSLIIAIFSTIFGLIIGCAAVTLALFTVAIILIIIAFFNIAGMPLVSLVLIGAALLTAALGILFMLLTVLLCGKALPAIFKGIVYVCGYPFRKKEVVV
ncbi:MAG: hypothetical protein Q4G60_01980 [bacterium]|nr:hypothetical protein [bacterium]